MEKELPVSGLSTRKLEVADMQAIKNFDRFATYEHNETPADHQPPEYTDEELQPGLAKGEITGIFDQDGHMVAYYWMEQKPAELYIGGIAVHPDYRNKGIGQFIMQQVESTALATGRNICTLTVDPYNGRGIHVYLKDGYRITGYDRNTYGIQGFVRFRMEKRLTTRETSNLREERQISVNDANADQIEAALREGFVGTSLRRSDQGDRENIIVFSR